MKNSKMFMLLLALALMMVSGTSLAAVSQSVQMPSEKVGITKHEEMLTDSLMEKMASINKYLITTLKANKAIISVDFFYPELENSLKDYEKSMDLMISLLEKINAEVSKETPDRKLIISMQTELQNTTLASIKIFESMSREKQRIEKENAETTDTIRGPASPAEKPFKSNLEY